MSAGSGATFAMMARGLSPPNQLRPSKRTEAFARRTSASVSATSSAVRDVDVADEAQRDVIVLRLEPARPDHAAARNSDRRRDSLGQLQSREQPRHYRFLHKA